LQQENCFTENNQDFSERQSTAHLMD